MTDLSYYSKEEFKEVCKSIPCDIVEIVYGYYHRDRTYTVESYANKQGISIATLYRYKHRVEKEFNRHR